MSEEIAKTDLGDQKKGKSGLPLWQFSLMLLMIVAAIAIGCSWIPRELNAGTAVLFLLTFYRIDTRAKSASSKEDRDNLRNLVGMWTSGVMLVMVLGVGSTQNTVARYLVENDRIVKAGPLVRPPLQPGIILPLLPDRYYIPVPADLLGAEGPEDILLVFKVPACYMLGSRCEDLAYWWSCDNNTIMSWVFQTALGKQFDAFCKECYASSSAPLTEKTQAKIKKEMAKVFLGCKDGEDIEYLGVIDPNSQDDQ